LPKPSDAAKIVAWRGGAALSRGESSSRHKGDATGGFAERYDALRLAAPTRRGKLAPAELIEGTRVSARWSGSSTTARGAPPPRPEADRHPSGAAASDRLAARRLVIQVDLADAPLSAKSLAFKADTPVAGQFERRGRGSTGRCRIPMRLHMII